MKLFSFEFLNRKNRQQEAEEVRVQQALEEFRQHPRDWDEAQMGLQSELREQILSRVLSSIPAVDQARNRNRRNWTVAASIAMLLGMSWLGFNYRENIHDFIDPATTIVLKTKNNEIRKVTLSDGSTVWLNGASTLSYPDRFRHDKREVVLLDGEAYFDIHHDEHKPFQVKAGKTLTNVLGTAFNISSYSWLEEIHVTVTRGKVAVNSNILLPNDQLTYQKATGKMEKKKLTADVTLWMQGKLVFSDESLKDIAAILENKYKVKIRFGEQTMEQFRFSARFEPSDSLNTILEDLTLTRGLSYEVKGDVITIINDQTN